MVSSFGSGLCRKPRKSLATVNFFEALKFEWRWKQISRQIQKKDPKINPREKRLQALDILIKLDKPTSNGLLYSSWENAPNIVYIKYD